MPATLVSDIVSQVITELSQVPGVATQIYATPRIQQYVQDAYLLELQEEWWPEVMDFFQSPLDGTTGRLTTALVPLLTGTQIEYSDVAEVWAEGSNRLLRQLPPGMNPFTISGSLTMYMVADYTVVNKPFRTYPITGTGTLVIRAQQSPMLPMSSASYVYIDPLLVAYDAAWMYCVDDGTVPAQVDKFSNLAKRRRQQMKSASSQQPLQLDPRFPDRVGANTEVFVLDGGSLLG